MRLYNVIRQHTRLSVVILSMVLGILSGALSTGLIILINEVVFARDQHPFNHLVGGFVALCIALPLVRYASSIILIVLGAETTYHLRIDLCRRILAAPLRTLETIGTHRLWVALTTDIGAIVGALLEFPAFVINTAVVVTSLIYMGWINWKVLLLLLAFMAVGGVSYQLCIGLGIRRQELMRHTQDGLFGHFKGVTEGTKELMLRSSRREAFVDDLEESARDYRDYQISAMKVFLLAANWGNLLFFIAIGLLLFSVVQFAGLTDRQMGSYVLLLIYMSPSLQAALQSLPGLTAADVSVRKVESLGISLVGNEGESTESPATESPATDSPAADLPTPEEGEDRQIFWQSLELQGVSHTYHSEEKDERFALGPIDLSLQPGQVTFVVGGNGSGKTTLAKLLLGLYLPDEGEIRFNGSKVTQETLDNYRENFSVVFSDFFLFEKLLGLDTPELESKGLLYLKKLHLNHKVRIFDGRFSTTDLSHGQRKRLALLNAYLEDSPIFVFDEWAADQDPEFKEVFYHQLLPELKARGKAVVAISHDDRYYDLADQLLRLEFGKQLESA